VAVKLATLGWAEFCPNNETAAADLPIVFAPQSIGTGEHLSNDGIENAIVGPQLYGGYFG
jgi:hypothetical protein